MNHEHWMQRALLLAERGRGAVEPNPLVGAVLVRNGEVVGEGWHQKFGQAHAEVNALAEAGERSRGAMAYVTLEPCCHFGKTPPCTEALIRAGVAGVYAAIEDPFPKVAGQGAEQLRRAGIPIEFGIGAAEARRQNAPYLTLLGRGRPYVHGKWAMSLDGKIATRTGDSKWISSAASRQKVHEIRGRMDGIVVGIGTVLADDPLLTARPPGPRPACRVVLDRQARTPLSCQLVQTAKEFPTLIVVGPNAPAQNHKLLEEAGCEVLRVPTGLELTKLMEELGRRRWTNLLVEGGGEVLASFFEAGLIDEVHVFIAPLVISGQSAKSPVSGIGIERLADATRFTESTTMMIESDVYYHAYSRDVSENS